LAKLPFGIIPLRNRGATATFGTAISVADPPKGAMALEPGRKQSVDSPSAISLRISMIKTFKSKDLADLWTSGRSKIDRNMHKRIIRRLDRLEEAVKPEEMNLPGFDFHPLRGKPQRYSVHVNGPWCITFEFDQGDAYRVDFEQYH
jgi:proteic killer suppression protein